VETSPANRASDCLVSRPDALRRSANTRDGSKRDRNCHLGSGLRPMRVSDSSLDGYPVGSYSRLASCGYYALCWLLDSRAAGCPNACDAIAVHLYRRRVESRSPQIRTPTVPVTSCRSCRYARNHHASAPFTLRPKPEGFATLGSLAPDAGPSMAFLSIASWLCLGLPSHDPSRDRSCLRL